MLGARAEIRAIPPFVAACLFAVVALGLVLRFAQYGHDREFWEDEAVLAVEIIQKTPLELTGVLAHDMNYPIGFLLVEKLMLALFGASEYAFRVFPLLAGLLSIVYFARLAWVFALSDRGADKAQTTLDTWGVVLVAVLCFSANKHLIYYSSELRQYAFELLSACMVYVLAGTSQMGSRSTREIHTRIVALSLFAIIAVWISLTVVYVLAAATLVQAWSLRARENRRSLMLLVGGSALWGISFLFHYGLIKSHIAAQDMAGNLQRYSAYMSPPLPPTSFAELQMLRESIEHLFYYPGGMTFIGLAIFTFGLGSLSLWKRDKPLFWMLLLPVLFAGLASALHQYPFRGRYLLFIIPAMCLLLGEGVGVFWRRDGAGLRPAGYLLAFMLLAQPLAHGLGVLKEPRTGPGGGSHTTQVLAYIQEHWQQGDRIFVHASQRSTFLYYKDHYSVRDEDYVLDDTATKFFALEIEPFRLPESVRSFSGNLSGSGRFWMLSLGDMDPDILQPALAAAGANREPLDTFRTPEGNVLVLYSWKP